MPHFPTLGAAAFLSLAFLLPCGPATATPVTWHVQGNLGGKHNFQGYFDYDADTARVTDFSIGGGIVPTIAGGPAGSCDDTGYTCSFAGFDTSHSSFSFEIDVFAGYYYEGVLTLDPAALLTDAGGTVALVPKQSNFQSGPDVSELNVFDLVSGTLTATPTNSGTQPGNTIGITSAPEPATYLLCAFSLTVIGLAVRLNPRLGRNASRGSSLPASTALPVSTLRR